MANEFKIKNGLILESGSLSNTSQQFVLTYNTSSGLVFYATASGVGGGGGGPGTPGGANTQIQFNSASAFSGSNRLTFDYTNNNLNLSGSFYLSGSQYFSTNDQNITATGQLGWDAGNATLDLGLSGSAGSPPALKIGQQLVARVFNAQGSTITKGQVVYVSGSQGNRIAVKLAAATDDPNSAGTLGLVVEDIANGAEGYVCTEGPLSGLNTTGLTAGALLYLSSSAGQYTQTKPQAPIHGVRLGYVERVHASTGTIYIKVDNGYEIDELHDVLISAPSASGDLLVRSGSLWINSKQLTGSYGLTGSLTLTGSGVTVFGTSSWADSASYAVGYPRIAASASSPINSNTAFPIFSATTSTLVTSTQYINRCSASLGILNPGTYQIWLMITTVSTTVTGWITSNPTPPLDLWQNDSNAVPGSILRAYSSILQGVLCSNTNKFTVVSPTEYYVILQTPQQASAGNIGTVFGLSTNTGKNYILYKFDS